MTFVVCPNLAVDRVVTVDRLEPGVMHRAHCIAVQAGGKGANVTRAVKALGGGAALAGYAAGHAGRLIAELAAGEGLEIMLAITDGESRVSTVVLEEDARATSLFEYGPQITARDQSALLEILRERPASAGEWAIVNGSAPPGADEGFFAAMTSELQRLGYRVMVDATATQLVSALGSHPDFVKVNAEEAATAVGANGDGVDGALRAGAALLERGAGGAAVTMGRTGAACLIRGRRYVVTTPHVTTLNAVGCGDCFAAALLVGLPLDRALRPRPGARAHGRRQRRAPP